MDLGPHLKSSIDDTVHRAKMAWKKGDRTEAANLFSSASELMYKYANYATSRNQEITRKKKGNEYRDFARRLRDTKDDSVVRDAPPLKPSQESSRPASGSNRVTADGDSKEGDMSSAVASMVQTSPLKWDDIGGLEETKADIKYTLGLSLAKPPEGVNLHTFRNILFYGPPGTGKTILAAATSNALRNSDDKDNATPAMFFNVKVSGVMSKFFGESSKLVSEIYGAARDSSPSVIFLDEFESLSGKRGSDEQSGAEKRILSTILSELDGLSEKGRSDIFVLTIAATNRPWDIDEAVLSRFEKRILIPLPDPDTRLAILNILFVKRGFETTANLSEIVELCDGYSGREIERLCKEVTTRMIREENKDLPSVVDSGLHEAKSYEVKVRPISIEDWQHAAKNITPGTSKAEMKKYLDWNDAVEQ